MRPLRSVSAVAQSNLIGGRGGLQDVILLLFYAAGIVLILIAPILSGAGNCRGAVLGEFRAAIDCESARAGDAGLFLDLFLHQLRANLATCAEMV